eukprot:318820-Hanusia_phi.AAC.1
MRLGAHSTVHVLPDTEALLQDQTLVDPVQGQSLEVHLRDRGGYPCEQLSGCRFSLSADRKASTELLLRLHVGEQLGTSGKRLVMEDGADSLLTWLGRADGGHGRGKEI